MSVISKKDLIKLFSIINKYYDGNDENYCEINFVFLKIVAFLLQKDDNVSNKKLEELKEILKNCPLKVKLKEMLDDYCIDLKKFNELVEKINNCPFKKNLKNILDDIEEWVRVYLPSRIYRVKIIKEFFRIETKKDIINSMHYKDEKKIDAKTFMQNVGFDEDLIEDLKEALKEFRDSAEFNVKVNEDYIESILKISSNIRKVFLLSGEFKDLSLAFDNLEEILTNLNVDEIDEDKKMILKTLLDSVFEDIEKWFKEVLIDKKAIDIHYLDAALFANIEQIKLLLENKELDSDLELF